MEFVSQLYHRGFVAVRSYTYPKIYYVYKNNDAVALHGRIEVTDIGTILVYRRTQLLGIADSLTSALVKLADYEVGLENTKLTGSQEADSGTEATGSDSKTGE